MSTPLEVMDLLYGKLISHHEDHNLDYMLAMKDIILYMSTQEWAQKDMVHIRQQTHLHPNKAAAAYARFRKGAGPNGAALLIKMTREPPRNYRLVVNEGIDFGIHLTRKVAMQQMEAMGKLIMELQKTMRTPMFMYVVDFMEGPALDACHIWSYDMSRLTWDCETITYNKPASETYVTSDED